MKEEPPSEKQVCAEVERVLREYLRVDRSVSPGLDLAHDLQLDSIGLLTLVVELERVFGVELREEDAGEVRTVGELAALIARRADETRAAGGMV